MNVLYGLKKCFICKSEVIGLQMIDGCCSNQCHNSYRSWLFNIWSLHIIQNKDDELSAKDRIQNQCFEKPLIINSYYKYVVFVAVRGQSSFDHNNNYFAYYKKRNFRCFTVTNLNEDSAMRCIIKVKDIRRDKNKKIYELKDKFPDLFIKNKN